MKEKKASDIEVRIGASRDLETSFCVEAGAGTGKTTILVSRYLSIIESGRAKCSEVVAITFTEKAATEMKIKIAEEISRRLENPEIAHRVRERLLTALYDIERAPISTIHSFASMILREYPIEAGVDPYFEQMDQLQSDLFIDRCWEDYLESLDEEGKKTVRLFLRAGGKPETLRSFSYRMLSRRGSSLIYTDLRGTASERSVPLESVASPPELQDFAQPNQSLSSPVLRNVGSSGSAPSRSAEAVTDGSIESSTRSFMRYLNKQAVVLKSLADEYCKNREDRGCVAIEEFHRAVEVAERLEAEELAIFLLGIPTGAKGNKGNWEPPEKCTEQKNLFKEISAEKERFKYTFSSYVRARMIDFFDGFTGFVDARKEAQSILDFDDLLIRARMLLGNRDVLRRLRRRFKFILVDEFQDTDPVQAEIVYLLSLSADGAEDEAIQPGKLFVVGDPKQSIYRFRGADVEVYERFKDILGSSGRVAGIVQNFRSVPGIIEWVNSVFSNVMKVPEDGRYQSEYRAIEPFREKGDGASVIYLDIVGDSGDMKKEDIRRIEGEAIARAIRKLVSSGRKIVDLKTGRSTPLTYGHIAVIYPVTTGIEYYEDVLRAGGIPYIIEGGKLYYTRQEVRDISNAVWAIEDPTDSLALVSVLRSPLFGVSDEDLFLFTRSGGRLDYMEASSYDVVGFDQIKSALGLLKELHESRNELGPAVVIKRLVERTNYFELCLLRPHGHQRVFNIKKVIQNAREFASAGHTFRRFAVWIRKQEQETLAESESPLVEEDEDAVRLLTIHKAKGLQFPVVFLANLVMGRSRSENLYVNGPGVIEFRSGILETEGYGYVKSMDIKREEAERARLLYVASTRAEDLLIVPVSSKEKSYFSIIEPYLPGLSAEGKKESFARMCQLWKLGDLPRLKGVDKPFVKMPLLTDGEVRKSTEVVEKWIAEHEKLIAGGSGRSIVISATDLERTDTPAGTVASSKSGSHGKPEEAPLAYDSGDPRRVQVERIGFDPHRTAGDEMRRFGVAFHRLMEMVDIERPSSADDLSKGLCEEYRIESMSGTLNELAKKALDSPLIKRAASSRVFHRELPFAFPVDSNFVTGRIDLVFRESGHWTIVDYKTDTVEADMVDSYAARYRLQGGIYALALSRAGLVPVNEVIFFFVRARAQSVLRIDEELLDETMRAVREALHR